MFSNFTKKYQVNKTIKMQLKPVGKTMQYVQERNVIAKDESLNTAYHAVKTIIDDFHRDFISAALKDVQLQHLSDVAMDSLAVRASNGKDEDAKTALKDSQKLLRKEIASYFTRTPELKERFTQMFKADLFKKSKENGLIQDWLLTKGGEDVQEKLELLNRFRDFTTYLHNFQEIREFLYSDEEKKGTIAYRIVHENLPRYLQNIEALQKIKLDNPEVHQRIQQACELLKEHTGLNFANLEDFTGYNHTICAQGIVAYNTMLGGVSTETMRLQGINAIIHEYNQTVDKRQKLPTLKVLYKQVLGDGQSLSFIPKQVEDDKQAMELIQSFHIDHTENLEKLNKLVSSVSEYNAKGVFLSKKARTEISNGIFKDYKLINRAIAAYFDKNHPESTDKKEDKTARQNQKDSYVKQPQSLYTVEQALASYAKENDIDYQEGQIASFFKGDFYEFNFANKLDGAYRAAKEIIERERGAGSRALLSKDNYLEVARIKEYLDAVTLFTHHAKLLHINSDDMPAVFDHSFYDAFTPLLEVLSGFRHLYSAVRSYITKRPSEASKFKLTFNNAQLLTGWDVNKEKDKRGVILRKDGKVYLALITDEHKKVFEQAPEAVSDNRYEKMVYKLLPDPSKMLPKVFIKAKKNLEIYKPSEELLRKYDMKTHVNQGNFNLSDCHDLINYFKDCLYKHEEWRHFDFNFSETSEYKNISEFYHQVSEAAYKVTFKDIDADYIDTLVDEGKLYLFEITNKDFRSKKGGKKSLFGMYFNELFSEENLKNPIYKLDGEAEIFFRKAVLRADEVVRHKAGEPIACKNRLSRKKEVVFEYDIVKDRRYTEDSLHIHIPMTINYGVRNTGLLDINVEARKAIKSNPSRYAIGIDRGERHLIYVSVVDQDGNIVEQKSLNLIETMTRAGDKISTDYNGLLTERHKERREALVDWSVVKNIKELKNGYLSYAVREVVTLMMKYKAPVFLEDLNVGFKHSRTAIEKQVYQNFENQLISKLSHFVDKNIEDVTSPAGVLNALQLVGKPDGVLDGVKQTGFVFFVPPSYTSAMCPKTGFVDFIRPHYSNIDDAKLWLSKLKDFAYNAQQDAFEFKANRVDFIESCLDSLDKDWTLTTKGDCRWQFVKSDFGGEYTAINVTEELKSLFSQYEIKYSDGELLTDAMLAIDDVKFFKKLMWLIKLTLQMRYSNPNTADDYVLSPVVSDGEQFDSRLSDSSMPLDADANGAYHIARKGHLLMERIASTEDELLAKVKLAVANNDWFVYVQRQSAAK